MKIRVLIGQNDQRAMDLKTIEIPEHEGFRFAVELGRFLDGWHNPAPAPQPTPMVVPAGAEVSGEQG